jgi:hypothetical protein
LRRGAPFSERVFAAGVGAMLAVGVVARIYVWRASYWGQGYGGPLETWLAARWSRSSVARGSG